MILKLYFVQFEILIATVFAYIHFLREIDKIAKRFKNQSINCLLYSSE